MKKRRGILVKMTNCPECDAGINVPEDAVEGEIVTCAECGASFELAKGCLLYTSDAADE